MADYQCLDCYYNSLQLLPCLELDTNKLSYVAYFQLCKLIVLFSGILVSAPFILELFWVIVFRDSARLILISGNSQIKDSCEERGIC